MATFVASLIIFIVAALAMAVGLVLGRRPLSGSCGGIAGRHCACGAQPGEACLRNTDDADPRERREDTSLRV